MSTHLKPAFLMWIVWTVITGMIYPALITGLAQLFFGDAANGSVITDAAGRTRGSRLIGQPFSAPQYFWGRPSATAPFPYNAGASTGSNQGPTNPALIDAVTARVTALHAAEPANTAPVPVDLITASGSGLDPHISPASAEYQIGRVARARNLQPEKVRELVARHTEGRQWSILGEPRVNVLGLNQALDDLP